MLINERANKNLTNNMENKKIHFSPYMLQIIDHTSEYREGLINMRTYVELVSSVSDMYDNYVRETKRNRQQV